MCKTAKTGMRTEARVLNMKRGGIGARLKTVPCERGADPSAKTAFGMTGGEHPYLARLARWRPS